MKFAELERQFVKISQNTDFWASCWGAGWKFDAPHA
jgi:hypothetical protein